MFGIDLDKDRKLLRLEKEGQKLKNELKKEKGLETTK